MQQLPAHLRKYIVEQDYAKYTALDHAVWRYVLRQLKSFLSRQAHASYLGGLEKTGIDIEQIPRIENISAKLEAFGWRALPVSGFIPPAAFMELQSLSILPIASDMRSIDHLLYTPAPDIVHEAAGHAPIIADPEYAAYLKQYAAVARKAIISKEDLEQYKAIRELSDLKENPASTPEQIRTAEEHLHRVSKSVSFVSEAAELSRMNWWTAEYGLVGDLNAPKIFGAGLLSSVGESQWCLSGKVRKIPLSLECIHQSYDITEPQPQLYVARDFHHLSSVLEELAATMSYRTGGIRGLDRAIQAESVNTAELDNGLQISGVLSRYLKDDQGRPAYLQFTGPAQLSFAGREIPGHGIEYHKEGYGTPVGAMNSPETDPEALQPGQAVDLHYSSGVRVRGIFRQRRTLGPEAHLLTLENATADFRGEILFRPEWGGYDIVTGHAVSSVYGGPSDRAAFGEIDDFTAHRVPAPQHSARQKEIFALYQRVRDLRRSSPQAGAVADLFTELRTVAPAEWLLFVELAEMAAKLKSPTGDIEAHLRNLAEADPKLQPLITEGLKLAYAEF